MRYESLLSHLYIYIYISLLRYINEIEKNEDLKFRNCL